ncbi:MAG: cobyric acid synthase CobQ, partial [Hyphomicrobiales bacterium]
GSRRGGHVLGLCGGYQMLGKTVRDPLGLEGPAGAAPGLGLLDIETELTPDKTVREVAVAHPESGTAGRAYEIHLGVSDGPDRARAPFRVDGRPEGARSADGRVVGTYLHGVLTSDPLRRAWLENLAERPLAEGEAYEPAVDAALDRLAGHLEHHLDIDTILALARSRS